MKLQALPDIGKGHLVALVPVAFSGVRIAEHGMHPVARPVDMDIDDARLETRLYAVVDGILDQRLQHQRRDERPGGNALDQPLTLRRSPSRLLEVG